jgi:hypothetical protein
MRRAKRPFVFTGCVELRQTLDHRATDERELLERLEEVPAGSVFYHTHGYFLRHRPITTAYGNDFAAWVAAHLRDQVLAERLAVVNPFEFATVEELREELASVIHDHLVRLSSVPRVELGEFFYFQQSHIVEVALGPGTETLAEFRRAWPPWTRAPSTCTWSRRARGWAAAPATSRSGSGPRSTCRSWPTRSSGSTPT